MNDPHVVALFYWLEHDDSIDYEEAPPLEGENDLLHFILDKRELRITPKGHYKDECEAKEELEIFVHSWEFDVAVESGRGKFSFEYLGAEIVDRNPGPPRQVGEPTQRVAWRFTATPGERHTSLEKYPSPPLSAKRDPYHDIARKILLRLERYHQGRETLATVAYFAVTALEDGAQGPEKEDRTRAAHYYRIGRNVINKVARLADEKGGSEARKSKGSNSEYTEEEKRFLVAAVQAFTRRAAEAGENPSECLEKITMETLRARANLS